MARKVEQESQYNSNTIELEYYPHYFNSLLDMPTLQWLVLCFLPRNPENQKPFHSKDSIITLGSVK